MRIHSPVLKLLASCLTFCALLSCNPSDHHAEGEGANEPAIEKGTHNGRMLRDKAFALELAIFETGIPPEFHAWGYDDGKLIDSKSLGLNIQLTRFGNKIDKISFTPAEDFLRSTTSIHEPHSFSVNITATYKGTTHKWQYDSFEGRTQIDSKMAEALGVATEVASEQTLKETLNVYGKTIPDPQAERSITARYDGTITKVHVSKGQQVTQGQALVTVESNESLKAITLTAPIAGTVVEQQARAGEQTQGKTLMRIIDKQKIWVDLAIFPEHQQRIKQGNPISIRYANGLYTGTIEQIGIELDDGQALSALAQINEAGLPPGALVEAAIEINQYKVPLAVKRSGLQSFRDFTVVYAQVGNEYEVRMLELGRIAGDWVEVLEGLETGTRYVTENSFVIKADIEKSGASHDH